jgi:hypothetical protein
MQVEMTACAIATSPLQNTEAPFRDLQAEIETLLSLSNSV